MAGLKTKIIVTLGPATKSYDIIKRLIKEGVSGFRINFSHGDTSEWDLFVKLVREAASELDQPTSLIGDLRGPQIRIGVLDQGVLKVERDQVLRFVFGEKAGEKEIPVRSKSLFETVEVGDTILVGDGECILRVVEVGDDYFQARALYDGVIGSGKKIVARGKEPNVPLLSSEDVSLVKYAVDREFTFIGVSYVRSGHDINVVRNLIEGMKGSTGIIAKIETPTAYRNLAEIVSSSDMVLIARGDLGLHFDLEKLPTIQKEVIISSVSYGRPVIVATQILESMVEQPRPSRSEVVDVYSAVQDMVDALMLTNETAVGKYPLETVRWLKKIIESAEANIKVEQAKSIRDSLAKRSLKDKYVHGLLSLAESVEGKVLVFSKTGSVPPLIARMRPQVPVIVGTPDRRLAERLTLFYGLKVYDMSKNVQGDVSYEEGIRLLESLARSRGELSIGDVVAESFARPGEDMHEILIKRILF
ncbi:pyruvate kinase [Thermogladius calderae 1633]|uniref:Pyruvate kinase n=1 Tax=Thermogladius calderae (strain DSM 22663 / VKM B-2946 / 1633) TaxID=1184251 RepID=I3TD49_THEC1|nr:pyruvate kinase [Thermogladius calderae]AFK50687.1 pyruvate kinase [Thermogladius calderae 1633]